MTSAEPWPPEVVVVVEVPRLGLIKRRDDGSIDYVSPLPCPFNYGSVPGTVSGDGDRADAVVLGPKLARGTRLRARVVARVDFVDAGELDPKWVCVPEGTARADLGSVVAFFRTYAVLKTVLNGLRGKRGPTVYRGLVERG